MASVKVSTSTANTGHQTVGIRRCKSHEPGQRVMMEAIAFLFTYYAMQIKDASFITPSAEEYFSYVAHLSTKTYHRLVQIHRRKVSNRLLGIKEPNYETIQSFLNFIEPCDCSSSKTNLTAQLIQAQNIGITALIVYNTFISDEVENSAKTHVVEPFVWYTGILYHDLIHFRDHGLGIALHFIQDGICYLQKNVMKKRISYFFELCSHYMERALPFTKAFDIYLQSLF
jgi:hypothetical protein